MIPKFRAWDKTYKTMYEADDIVYIDFEEKQICVKTLFFERASRYDFDDIVLMQSTGLTDKNGKEIFEGDVLCDEGLEQEDEFVYVTVSYKNGMWICARITNDDCGYGGALNEFAEDYSVIGNVYQNKELLEVQDS